MSDESATETQRTAETDGVVYAVYAPNWKSTAGLALCLRAQGEGENWDSDRNRSLMLTAADRLDEESERAESHRARASELRRDRDKQAEKKQRLYDTLTAERDAALALVEAERGRAAELRAAATEIVKECRTDGGWWISPSIAVLDALDAALGREGDD